MRSILPGQARVAVRPSARVILISPSGVLNTVPVIPGPPDTVLETGTDSRSDSHAAIRSAVGLSCSAAISPAMTGGCGWSSVAASSDRHGVARGQPKSVAPGLEGAATDASTSRGASAAAESVTRRCASAPRECLAGASGASSGHQVTTGTSGTSSGATTESACCPRGPYMRSTIVSPGEDSPTRISASSRESPFGLRAMTARTRHGCSRAAWLAARMASYCAASSVTMMSVSTMPSVMPPSRRRASVSAWSIAPVVVSVRSIVIGVVSLPYRLQPAPGAAVACHPRVGGRRGGTPRRVVLRLVVLGPELLDLVEDAPGQLDLLLTGEERRVADQDVKDQPLVGL